MTNTPYQNLPLEKKKEDIERMEKNLLPADQAQIHHLHVIQLVASTRDRQIDRQIDRGREVYIERETETERQRETETETERMNESAFMLSFIE